jgi:predicted nucleic acid-binding protein
LKGLLSAGVSVRVPEIADYEIRRELLRAGKTEGISRLDQLKQQIGYVPLTTEIMLLAAQFWADARNQGLQTASDQALDADVIPAAQAEALENGSDNSPVEVATENPRHLSRFVTAKLWWEIGQSQE